MSFLAVAYKETLPPPLFLSVSQTDYCYKKRARRRSVAFNKVGAAAMRRRGTESRRRRRRKGRPAQTDMFSFFYSLTHTYATHAPTTEEEEALPEWLFLWGRGVERRRRRKKERVAKNGAKNFSLSWKNGGRGWQKKHPSWCLDCWLRGCSDLLAACLVSGGRGGRRPRPPRERVAVGGGRERGWCGGGRRFKGTNAIFLCSTLCLCTFFSRGLCCRFRK